MSCFGKCFDDRASSAATTIGKYYRGNQARSTYKKQKLLAVTVNKVTLFGLTKPRSIKVSDDEKSLSYSKASAPTPTALLFADMSKISIASNDVKIVMKSGKSYTLRSETTAKARNIYFALSQYVDAKVMQSTPVPPAPAAAAAK